MNEDIQFDATALPSVEELDIQIEKEQKQQDSRNAVNEAALQDEQQYTAAQEDPRNAERWGIKGVAKEAQSIVSGGLQDTASSVTTFGERTIDALTGQRQKEIDEVGYYRPDWDPFVDYEDPIITKVSRTKA